MATRLSAEMADTRQPVDFYFDFISPYAYLASRHIEEIARRHGRAVRWHAFRLGVAVVKVMGLRPVLETPLKGAYSRQDVARLSAVLGEPLTRALDVLDPIPAGRLFHAVSPKRAGPLARALLAARWAQGRDIAQPAVLEAVVGGLGWPESLVATALADPATREALTQATRSALARGVFGSPTAAVGQELFWGTDRLWLLDHYLAAGERYTPLDDARQASLGLRQNP
ncbi:MULTISPECIES: DsbA family protein [Cupriavidus]